MTKHGRVTITFTKERLDLLNIGREVSATQGGVRYLFKAEVGCCDAMRKLLGTRMGRKFHKTMMFCPYCQKSVLPTSGTVYLKRSNNLKGCKRVKDPVTGRYSFVKPEDMVGVRGHSV